MSASEGSRFGGEGQDAWFWDWDKELSSISPSHAQLQQLLRNFVDTELMPNIAEWEEQGGFPRDLHNRAYAAGVYGIGQPAEYGGTPPTNPDMWHRFIVHDELGRLCAGGLTASLFTMSISLPPILALGTLAQKEKYAREIITAQKTCSLAITEPSGGSDVAAMSTQAVQQGDVYVLDGVKTFISGGINADYFTVAARTSDNGLKGISLFLVPKELPGVTTTRLKTQGWNSSTTTTIAFDGVKVPVGNMLGEKNKGFLPIMLNFNSERFGMAIGACRMARCCLEDALRYARVRKTFGKPLMAHQVVRHKIMEMARNVLATYGFMNTITHSLIRGADAGKAAGWLALAKVQATKTFEFCAREASQILGGKSYLRGDGPGGRIERCYREVRVFAIGGGSEEIMLELASRQAKL